MTVYDHIVMGILVSETRLPLDSQTLIVFMAQKVHVEIK